MAAIRKRYYESPRSHATSSLGAAAAESEVIHAGHLPPILDEIGKVDIVFLDLEVPELDGYEVLGVLKANPNFQGKPIVAYTVHVSEIDVAHQQGFHSFIGKPLDADRFPDQIARILRGEQVWELP